MHLFMTPVAELGNMYNLCAIVREVLMLRAASFSHGALPQITKH